MTQTPHEPPLVYRVEQLPELLDMGINQCYRAIARGELPSVKIGRRILVPRQRLLAMLNGEPPDSEAAARQPRPASETPPPSKEIGVSNVSARNPGGAERKAR